MDIHVEGDEFADDSKNQFKKKLNLQKIPFQSFFYISRRSKGQRKSIPQKGQRIHRRIRYKYQSIKQS